MPIDLTFLGHSGFLIKDADTGKAVCVDPFLTGNPLAKHKPEDIQCDYVALTHGHEDHFNDDAIAIAKNNNATVIGAYELCVFVSSECGHDNIDPGNPGGRVHTDFGYVAFTPAFHSSSYKGRYMGQPMGLVFSIGGVKLYHCGDTALFSDMKLIGEVAKPDIAMIPCGDRFTMGTDLATMAAEFIKPKFAVPIHYKTFGVLNQSIEGFEPKGVEVREMQPGETWRYPG